MIVDSPFIAKAQLHTPRPWYLYGYVWPFVATYCVLVALYVVGFFNDLTAFFVLSTTALLNISSFLFCEWSLSLKCAAICRTVEDPVQH